jgi:hypothetical protein
MFQGRWQTKGEAEMKLTRVIWIRVLLITIFLSQTSCGLVYSSKQLKTEPQLTKEINQSNPDESAYLSENSSDGLDSTQVVEVAKIRSATLLIRMQAPKAQSTGGRDLAIGLGMGSLIRIQDEILLVTHNHWGELLQDVTLIEFRDADNQLIIATLGYELKEWIVSQDAGSLVLRLPKEFIDSIDPSAPIRMDSIPKAEAGERVEVVYRENPAREKATILEAVVEEVITYKGLPAYRLRSLDGQPIKPGDSGGGIWYKGRLVGNNWVTVMEKSGSVAETSGSLKDEDHSYTGISIAATLAYGFDP